MFRVCSIRRKPVAIIRVVPTPKSAVMKRNRFWRARGRMEDNTGWPVIFGATSGTRLSALWRFTSLPLAQDHSNRVKSLQPSTEFEGEEHAQNRRIKEKLHRGKRRSSGSSERQYRHRGRTIFHAAGAERLRQEHDVTLHCRSGTAGGRRNLYRRSMRILSKAADRKSVVKGKSVDLGGRRIIKKKKK